MMKPRTQTTLSKPITLTTDLLKTIRGGLDTSSGLPTGQRMHKPLE